MRSSRSKRPGQRVGGRLVAGQHERHQLVAQLVIGQRLARPRRGPRAAARARRRARRRRRPRGARGSPRTSAGRRSPQHRGEDSRGLAARRVAQLDELVQRRRRGRQQPADRLAHPLLGLPRCGPPPIPNTPRMITSSVTACIRGASANGSPSGQRSISARRPRRSSPRSAATASPWNGGSSSLRWRMWRAPTEVSTELGPRIGPQRRLAGQRRRIVGLGLEQRPHVVGVAGDDEPLAAGRDAGAATRRRTGGGRSSKVIGRRREAQTLQRRRQRRARAAAGSACPGRPARRARAGRRDRSRAASAARCGLATALTVRDCTAPGRSWRS